ncbi:dUTP diphosphatase [Bacillus amyloliquefaciens]|uniref:dUTP diphosphatase n=1 Tax=Bacillus amyloliquefaciens TaxID=1390 RepID=UPI002808C6CC|nr:dUTP diphosphatase [Bacillus amyloliquefaciens]MDQ8093922.1 dUTP diphosphatase [Bacillus amyloliquefaciens]
MNLQKMFEMQKVLDDRIIKEKGLEGQDLLPNLILALQVELAECANEWRGFKHWSNDREPRNHCKLCQLIETPHICQNPLLEEYVDCLHFILSIGNQNKLKNEILYKLEIEVLCENEESTAGENEDISKQFIKIFSCACELYFVMGWNPDARDTYRHLYRDFTKLGEMLSFTTEEIEAAYMEKNAVNHQRQQEGY